MNKLWTYGCSWTYFDIHKFELGMTFWPEIISERLNLELINRAWGGKGTDYSIGKLLSDLSKIEKGDFVVFQFSYPSRLDLPYLHNNFKRDYWNNTDIGMNSKIFDHNNEDKMIVYMEFAMTFAMEILLKQYEYVSYIFDYLENLGAIVRFWFVSFSNFVNSDYNSDLDPNSDILKYIKTRISKKKNQIISFSYYDHIDEYSAEMFIEGFKIADYNYNRPDLDWLKNDTHPNHIGQQKIARKIIDSFRIKFI